MEKVTLVLETNRSNIKKAISALREGGLVIYPTESSYAIGCDFTNKEALDNLLEIKERSKEKHITVIVDSLNTVGDYVKLKENELAVVGKFMPGPLTLTTIRGKKEFNFRMSNHPIANKLARALGKPIVATSANISGQMPIYDEIDFHQFFGKVDIILDYGDLPKNPPSTVVAVYPRFKTIRKGPVKIDSIKKLLKNFR